MDDSNIKEDPGEVPIEMGKKLKIKKLIFNKYNVSGNIII